MRHGKKFNHIGRTAPHRKAMLANMASSLIVNKRITTTVAKAKALKKYVEPLITKSKADNTHSRRTVFSYLRDKESSRELFNEVAQKVGDRPGGYTRIIKMGNRLGDNAELCMIELVDYNDLLVKEQKEATTKKRRSRRGKKKSSSSAESTEASAAVEAKEDKAEGSATTANTTEETTDASEPEPKADDTKDQEDPDENKQDKS
jgi:large subunit ribosomal protein L17